MHTPSIHCSTLEEAEVNESQQGECWDRLKPGQRGRKEDTCCLKKWRSHLEAGRQVGPGKLFLDTIFQVHPLWTPAKLKAKWKVGISSQNVLHRTLCFLYVFKSRIITTKKETQWRKEKGGDSVEIRNVNHYPVFLRVQELHRSYYLCAYFCHVPATLSTGLLPRSGR